jgi:hypothetical protein
VLEPIEDELGSRGDVDGRVAARAEMEFRAGIDADDQVELAIAGDPETLSMWFLSGGRCERLHGSRGELGRDWRQVHTSTIGGQ